MYDIIKIGKALWNIELKSIWRSKNMPDEKEKFDATKYKNDFQKEKYDRIIVNVPKGQKQIIDESAKKLGYKSLNSFVVDAINEKLETSE